MLQDSFHLITDSSLKGKIIKVLNVLFPETKTILSNNFNSSVDDEEILLKLRVCTVQHFDKYFNFDFEAVGDQILYSDISSILDCESKELNLRLINKYIHKDLSQAIMDRLRNAIDKTSDIPVKNLNILLLSIFEISEEYYKSYTDLMIYRDFGTMEFVGQSILKKCSKNNAFSVLSEAIKITDCIYMPCRLVKVITAESQTSNGRNDYINHKEISLTRQVLIAHLIKHQDTFIHRPYWNYICDVWNELDDSKSYINYRKSIYNDNDLLFVALSKLQHLNITNNVQTVCEFDFPSLEKTHDLLLIQARLKEILSSDIELSLANNNILDSYVFEYGDYLSK